MAVTSFTPTTTTFRSPAVCAAGYVTPTDVGSVCRVAAATCTNAIPAVDGVVTLAMFEYGLSLPATSIARARSGVGGGADTPVSLMDVVTEVPICAKLVQLTPAQRSTRWRSELQSAPRKRCARSLAAAVTAGTLGRWDELVLPMMDGDGAMPALLVAAFRDAGLTADVTGAARAPVHLLPATWDEYLKRLSCTHRRQIALARAFDEWAGGTARLERVTDPAGLEEGKRILTALHHARWQDGGRSGVFRSPLFLAFHDAIMRQLLDRDALELTWLRRCAGSQLRPCTA